MLDSGVTIHSLLMLETSTQQDLNNTPMFINGGGGQN